MLTDTSARPPTPASRFVLRGVAASLGLFGLLRLAWTEAHVVLPITHMQASLAARWFGPPALPVEVTLACSGADALALCLGAILAYPVPWRTRLAGIGGGVFLTLALNTIRIGTLGRAASSPAWFSALHLYIWPAVLTLAIAAYVFSWMRLADRATRDPAAALPQPSRRFVVLAAVFLLIFLAASPLYLQSTAVLALTGVVARAAAATLSFAGMSASASANLLWTPRGGYLVTQECIATPLIPVYLAAVCAYSTTWRRMVAGMVGALPIFVGLGLVRLLLVALPSTAGPLFFVHAFYQLLAGAVVVCAAALWRHRRTPIRHAAGGLAVGVVSGLVLAPWLVRVIGVAGGAAVHDPQGAIAFLPVFQIGLYVALCVAAADEGGWRRFVTGFGLLVVAVTSGVLALHIADIYVGLAPHVRDIRAWAIVAPVIIFAAVVNLAPSRE